jgi:hypothetical protein
LVDINTLFIRTITGGKGTNGHIYLGIDGKEFYVDADDRNDFEPGDDHIYIAGELPSPMPAKSSQIWHSLYNDPRKHYPLDTDNLDRYDVYIRFEPRNVNDPDDRWTLQYVSVEVNPASSSTRF